jgi:catechol 2,3-dioxygenase-like lactoylglutathione lyase family enzyme
VHDAPRLGTGERGDPTEEAAISTVERTPAEARVPGIRRGDFLRRTAVAGLGIAGAGALLEGANAEGNGGPVSSPLDALGLHDRINRIDRIVTNVSDLEKAKAFWEATTPLRAYARTQAPRQAFRTLGIQSGQFDGYLLRDPGGVQLFSVHLVEWKDPKPVGRPYRSAFNVGWYRLGFGTSDVDAAYQRVVAAGGDPFTKPLPEPLFMGAPASRVFVVPDPDGMAIEYYSSGKVEQVDHIASSTEDVEKTRPFYTDVLGLDFLFRLTSCPGPNVYSPDGGEAGWDTSYFAARGDTRFGIDHLSWSEGPPAQGASKVIPGPYDIFGQPTHLGYVRLSLEVDDIDAAYRSLLRAGLSPKNGDQLRVSGPPEEWDFGPEFGQRKVVVFTDPEGVGFELIQQAPYPGAVHTSPPIGGACFAPGSVSVPPQPGR